MHWLRNQNLISNSSQCGKDGLHRIDHQLLEIYFRMLRFNGLGQAKQRGFNTKFLKALDDERLQLEAIGHHRIHHAEQPSSSQNTPNPA